MSDEQNQSNAKLDELTGDLRIAFEYLKNARCRMGPSRGHRPRRLLPRARSIARPHFVADRRTRACGSSRRGSRPSALVDAADEFLGRRG